MQKPHPSSFQVLFRFGKNIARAASTVLRTFFGETRPVLGAEKPDAIVPGLDGDSVTYVCRTNATIFEQGAFAAEQGKKIALAAGNFEKFLEEIMDIYFLYAGKLSQVKERRIARFGDFRTLLEFAMLIDPELESKAQIVMNHGNRVPGMVQAIQSATVALVGDADILLTTCHKAKGMEWENVVVAGDFADLLDKNGAPLPVGTAANPPTENGRPVRFVERDEVNLIYVAMTRSLSNLAIRLPDLKKLISANWGNDEYCAPKQERALETPPTRSRTQVPTAGIRSRVQASSVNRVAKN